MKHDINKLAVALKKANQVALEVNNIKEDGGSCNFDHAVMDFTGWRETEVQWLRELSGLPIGEKMNSTLWKGYRDLGTARYGQGYNRTRMAEAASKSLEQDGINATVFYMID